MPRTHSVTLAEVPLTQQRQFGNVVRSSYIDANIARTRVVELYECDEGQIERVLPFDEFFYCLKGEEIVHNLDTGTTHVVKEGDVMLFEKGARVSVTYTQPFRAIMVFVSDDDFRIDEYEEGL